MFNHKTKRTMNTEINVTNYVISQTDLVQISTPKQFTGYAESRIGGRAENQDSVGYAETPFGFLITVCDGMGGGPGGKTASTIAVNEIIRGVIEGNQEEEISNILIKAIRRANLAIFTKGDEVRTLKGMGSTCTVLLINKECAYISHIGDSRVYQLRGKSKVFRTFDHSMVFDLVKQGVITEEQARLSAQSNIITKALGIKPDLEVEVTVRPYLSGDRFLLCTDGIHGTMPEKELIKHLADKKHSLGAIADELATIVDGTGRAEGGGHDNLTLALIETNINSNLKEKMSKKTKLLLSALTIVCAISIIGNIVSLSRKSPETALQHDVHSLDSINGVYKDSIKQLSISIEQLKKDTCHLQKDLAKKEVEMNKVKKENEKLNNKLDSLRKSNNDKAASNKTQTVKSVSKKKN
jgi:protein phosphatase